MHATLGIPLDAASHYFAIFFYSILKSLHLLGLVFGLGAATMLDLIILRFLLKKRIAAEHWNIIEFISKSVTAGLAMLWVSGLGLFIHYALVDPGKLDNPKLWAKLNIVLILTANGVLINLYVLPEIRSRIGRHFFNEMRNSKRDILLMLGTVSAVSWYVPLLLAAVPLFNFTMSTAAIFATYAMVLIGGMAGVLIASRLLLPEPSDITSGERTAVEALDKCGQWTGNGLAELAPDVVAIGIDRRVR